VWPFFLRVEEVESKLFIIVEFDSETTWANAMPFLLFSKFLLSVLFKVVDGDAFNVWEIGCIEFIICICDI